MLSVDIQQVAYVAERLVRCVRIERRSHNMEEGELAQKKKSHWLTLANGIHGSEPKNIVSMLTFGSEIEFFQLQSVLCECLYLGN